MINIIIDTSIILAALIRDSTVREILLSEFINFIIPEHTLDEIEKHKHYILEKSGYSELEYEVILSIILENIDIIKLDKIKKYIQEGEKIMKDRDINDSIFIACGLALKNDGIYSFDDDFKCQNKIKIWTTKELLGHVREKSNLSNG